MGWISTGILKQAPSANYTTTFLTEKTPKEYEQVWKLCGEFLTLQQFKELIVWMRVFSNEFTFCQLIWNNCIWLAQLLCGHMLCHCLIWCLAQFEHIPWHIFFYYLKSEKCLKIMKEECIYFYIFNCLAAFQSLMLREQSCKPLFGMSYYHCLFERFL